jgi:imidazolonepropionase-like amidohydrolase
MLDVDKGELIEPGDLLVDGERIVEVAPTSVPDEAVVVDLGDLTLLPGLMDIEVNLLMGGPDHRSPLVPVQQAKAAEVFPRAKRTISRAIERGARIACGTDARAIPHGRNAKEMIALVDRGMTPLQAIRAATTVAAELIDVDDRGRLAPGLLADVIAVPGDPLVDITVTEQVSFVMKGGQVHRDDQGDAPRR